MTDRAPTAGGIPLTDELVDRLAREAEDGYDVSALRRRGGRRPLGSAAATVVPVRLDPELEAALTARAESDDVTASEVIRQALRARLHVA
jgi:Ribbon-helix-helix protein, copG family